METKPFFSQKTDVWATPKHIFDKLNNEFRFTLDPCSTEENKKCEKHYTELDDGLSKSWANEVVFMNPPYSKCKDWMRKAYESSKEGATVVCLVPSRTDTAWWHEFAMKGEIRFIRGRIKFGDSKNAAPFPSCVIVFRPS